MSRETQGDEALYEYGQLPCKQLCLARAVTKHEEVKHLGLRRAASTQSPEAHEF